MDFFEAQKAARRRTGLLIALFGAAVIAIIVCVCVVMHFFIGEPPETATVDLELLFLVVPMVGATIASGIGFRIDTLRRGGPAVAELVGGRRVAPDTTNLEERRLLNIVEEMSIASGIPIPAVYVMDREDGINAFAAGYSIHDAAIGVTFGALQALTRDELQGVIAHEYSHILNGDMRLNIHLVGVLYGILMLSIVGRAMVAARIRRMLSAVGRRSRRRKGTGVGGVTLPPTQESGTEPSIPIGFAIFPIGFAIWAVGYVGVLFGRLIKAAVSRQREYLADSAAVQFTRNPRGLVGALKKIGASTQGSRVEDPHAEELSHLFFANGISTPWFGMYSTHPPIEERIRRIDLHWDGLFTTVSAVQGTVDRSEPALARHGFEGIAAAATPPMGSVSALISSVGAPSPDHLAYARALLERIPESLTSAMHEPNGAEALLFALVIAGSSREQADAAEREVDRYGGAELAARVSELIPMVEAQGAEARLPLLDLALPAVQTRSPSQVHRLRAAIERIVRDGDGIRTFQYALVHTLARRLGAGTTRIPLATGSGPPLDRFQAKIITLSAVAWVGASGDVEAAERAFAAGVERLRDVRNGSLVDRTALDLRTVDSALGVMEEVDPDLRLQLLEACAAAVAQDGNLGTAEAELLRAIAEGLDCPIPPLLRGGFANREVSVVPSRFSPPPAVSAARKSDLKNTETRSWLSLRAVVARIIFVISAIFWVLLFVGLAEAAGDSQEALEIFLGGLLISAVPLFIAFMLERSYRLKRSVQDE